MNHSKRSSLEYLALVLNRGAAPGSLFLTYAILSRILPEHEFQSFILTLSGIQWIIAFAFQWQKNCIVRFYGHSEYKSDAYRALAGSSALILAGGLVCAWLDIPNFGLGSAIYCVLVGLLYYYGATSRMSGNIYAHATAETISHPARWAAVVGLAALSVDGELMFAAGAATLILPILYLAHHTTWPKPAKANTYSRRRYISMAANMAVFDFSAAAMMYADRFYVAETNYVIYSTIGTQVASILMGSYVSTMYPRLNRAAHGIVEWQPIYARYFRRLPLIAILTLLGMAIGGPLLIRLMSPSTPVDHVLLGLHTLCQLTHFLIVVFGMAFIMHHKNWIPAILYAACASVYLAHLYIAPQMPEWAVLLVRLSYLAVLAGLVATLGRRISSDHL